MDQRKAYEYIHRQCSPAEVNALTRWFQTPEGEAYLHELLDEDIKNFEAFRRVFVYPPIRSASLFDRILQSTVQADTGKAPSSGSRYAYGWAAIACILAVLLAGFAFWNGWMGGYGADSERLFITQKGEMKTVQLPDGSTVQLNADSRLRLGPEFSDSLRTIIFEGEAYFQITSNPQRPFRIQMNDGFVEVLGTAFQLNAYSGNPFIEVAVREGRVALGTGRQGVADTVQANEAGTISVDAATTAVVAIEDWQTYLGWTQGSLVFKNAPLAQVAVRLERWYDVTCRISDPAIASTTFTSTFTNEPLDEVLHIIALSTGIQYEKKGDTIRFKPANTKP